MADIARNAKCSCYSNTGHDHEWRLFWASSHNVYEQLQEGDFRATLFRGCLKTQIHKTFVLVKYIYTYFLEKIISILLPCHHCFQYYRFTRFRSECVRKKNNYFRRGFVYSGFRFHRCLVFKFILIFCHCTMLKELKYDRHYAIGSFFPVIQNAMFIIHRRCLKNQMV